MLRDAGALRLLRDLLCHCQRARRVCWHRIQCFLRALWLLRVDFHSLHAWVLDHHTLKGFNDPFSTGAFVERMRSRFNVDIREPDLWALAVGCDHPPPQCSLTLSRQLCIAARSRSALPCHPYGTTSSLASRLPVRLQSRPPCILLPDLLAMVRMRATTSYQELQTCLQRALVTAPSPGTSAAAATSA